MSNSTNIRELGIATLDTCQLSQREDIEIQTRMFQVGESKRSRKAQKFWPRQFLFGVTEEIEDTEIIDLLRTILTPSCHHIILVGHSISSDCHKIKLNYGIDLNNEPAVLAVIDTSRLASAVNNLGAKHVSLCDTCLLCGITPEYLHNAGNDAVYTLRATLLLLKCHQAEKMFYTTLRSPDHSDQDQIAPLWEHQLERLGRISRAHETVVSQHLQRMRNDAEERREMKRRRKAAGKAVRSR